MNIFNCCESVNINTSKVEQDALITLEMVVALTELEKNNKKIKELNIENFKLKEENISLKKEKELLKKNLELSEEIRNNSSERKVIELQEDKRELQYKIQELEYDLAKQTQLNVYLVQLLREKEE
jgi:mannose/fructose/N-acetylgalactosamine-specific phosphotransferase system component IIB